MSKQASLLISESPLLVYPTLAKELGINKAVMIQQLHFLLNNTRTSKHRYNFVNGAWWVYNSYDEWQKDQFPWLSTVTIKRLFLELEDAGYVRSMQSVKNPSNRKKWYTIDYTQWEIFMAGIVSKWDDEIVSKRYDEPSDQNDTMVGSKRYDGSSETTTESGEELIAAPENGAAGESLATPEIAATPTPEKKTKPRKDGVIPAALMNPMKDRIAALFQYKPWKQLTKAEIGVIQNAAHQLCAAGYSPDDATVIFNWCQRQGWNGSFTPMVLATKASEATKGFAHSTNGSPTNGGSGVHDANYWLHTPNPPPGSPEDAEKRLVLFEYWQKENRRYQTVESQDDES